MSSAFLQTVLANFLRLLPFRFVIIQSYWTGVRFRLGSPICRVSHRSGIRTIRIRFDGIVPKLSRGRPSGLHFYWAWFEDIFTINKVSKVMETGLQTVTTKDGVEVTVSLSVCYRIPNAKKYWQNVEDFGPSLENISQSYMTMQISKSDYSEIVADPGKVTESMRLELNKMVRNWGAHISLVAFVNTPRARSIRLLGNSGWSSGD